MNISDDQIKQMVTRFLTWKLPKDFNPDGGISYSAPHDSFQPVGTNLFTATQAEEMIRHMLDQPKDDLLKLSERLLRIAEQAQGVKGYGVTANFHQAVVEAITAAETKARIAENKRWSISNPFGDIYQHFFVKRNDDLKHELDNLDSK